MKEKMKFMVAVFGVTIATFGSLNAKAISVGGIRCSGSTGSCVQVQLANGHTGWLSGIRTNV